jgi:protein-L-isoaspartate(D-aspartate) O-methyltransferase
LTLEERREVYARAVCSAVGVTSPALRAAFAKVRREEFLGPGPWLVIPARDEESGRPPNFTADDPRALYEDVLISIDRARGLNNGQPSALAHWIDALELKRGERVFHAGCGLGYYTAILAETVGAEGRVTAAEIDCGLAERAKKNLAGWPQVSVEAGDAVSANIGMCDAMLINAGLTHPRLEWLERLKDGGRMVAPITSERGDTRGNGVMLKITRTTGGFRARVVSFVSIYPCSSARDPKLEAAVAKALRARKLVRVQSVRTDPHEAKESCLIHGATVCLSEEAPAPFGGGGVCLDSPD